jgi:hypothetical protein
MISLEARPAHAAVRAGLAVPPGRVLIRPHDNQTLPGCRITVCKPLAYIPKDKLAAWFEAYVESMELNYCTATEFEGGTYNEKEGRRSVVAPSCGRHEAGDAPAARRHGHRSQRYSKPSGYSDFAQLRRHDSALNCIMGLSPGRELV